MKKKILFGAVDIGHRIETYSNYIQKYHFKKLKPESLAIFILPEEHYKLSYTYEYHFAGRNVWYRWSRATLIFFFFFFRYDIFHFLSGETLLPRKVRQFELMVYKIFGKRIIMHFVGCDIRSLDYSYWKAKNIKQYLNGLDNFPKSLPWQKKLIKDTQNYADEILVSSPDLLEIIPEATYFPVLLDLEKFLNELNKAANVKRHQGEIIILHSPSNIKHTQTKGTDYIINILNKIAATREYNIRLILPSETNKKRNTTYSSSRYEMFQHYNEADIIIDQLITGWYGLLSLEALASGKQAICYVDEHLKKYLFPKCPINIATVNNLENVVIECIENILNGKLPDQSAQIDWVRKYHTIENNNAPLLKAWGL
ncbi:MAG TPA: hypothetical protein VI757_11460 [Bacteroidia bacterium]|nr:hypothetical protein [Bacteroidia bacterium]